MQNRIPNLLLFYCHPENVLKKSKKNSIKKIRDL